MKNYKLIIFSFMIILQSSCDKDDVRPEYLDYFPLHIGDSWTYESGPLSIIHRIDKTEVIDGLLYYHMIQEVDTDVSEIGFYRKTADGKVYFRSNGSPEELRFDLKANEGTTWTTDTGQDNAFEWHIRLVDDSETYQIGNKKLSNCLLFDFDVPQMADEEHSILLAPGIGIVSNKAYAWGGETRLYEATIDGNDLEF